MQRIKVDVDRGRPLTVYELARRLRRANRRPVALRQWRSPSGRGWHLLVQVRPAPRSAMETVALQLLVGSDVYREAYNLNRAGRVDRGQGPPWWNVLYGAQR